MEFVEAVLLTVIAASTPLLLAASGELVVERGDHVGPERVLVGDEDADFHGPLPTGRYLGRRRLDNGRAVE